MTTHKVHARNLRTDDLVEIDNNTHRIFSIGTFPNSKMRLRCESVDGNKTLDLQVHSDDMYTVKIP